MAKKQGKSTSSRSGAGIKNGVKAVSRPIPKPKTKPGRPRFGSQH